MDIAKMEIETNRRHHCSFCGLKCRSKNELENHMRKHTRERPFYCDKCKRGFASQSILNTHKICVHQQEVPGKQAKKYKCPLCPYVVDRKSSLERHILSHTNERSFPCQHPGCKYAAKSSRKLKIHVTHRHENERKYLCPVPNCDYRGKTTVDMYHHSTKHSEGRPFVCDFEGCGYRAKTKQDLECHKLGVHNGGFKPFACSICNYRTPFKSALKSHERTHAEEKSIKCEFRGCSYSCTSQVLLRCHVLSWHSEKNFKCDFANCRFSTARRALLDRHERRVHSEKAYKCPHCDYRGADSWYMRTHIAKHNSNHCNKPIPCVKQGCTFQARNEMFLKRHLEFHEENLSCPVKGCGYVGTSSSSSGWRHHMQLHDPTGRPFHCPLCPKHFSANHLLSSHLRTHTEEKPYQCPVCNYDSASTRNMMRHVRAFHPRVSPLCAYDNAESICDHCGVNYGCALGLAMHSIKLKTAVVVLTRLHIEIGT